MKDHLMDSPQRPEPILTRAKLHETLVTVLDHVMNADPQIEYRLVGTAAALLHGVQLPAADVDLLVRKRAAVDAFGAGLSSFRCIVEPAWLPEARQYYGNYDVNGVEVGISTVEVETEADFMETTGCGPWEHFTLVSCGPYSVPTVVLELRLITEVFRNRPNRYGPIVRHMREHGFDAALVRRGLASVRMPGDFRERILRHLADG